MLKKQEIKITEKEIIRREKISLTSKGRISPMKGKHHSEETKEKIREKIKGRISPMKGRKHSDETKRKIRLISLGRKHSEESKIKMKNKIIKQETRDKLSLINKGKKLSNEHKEKIGLANSISNKGKKPWIAGKHHSEETKEKMSLAHKGFKHSEETKCKLRKSNTKPENLQLFRLMRSKQKFPIKDTSIEIKVQNILNFLNIYYIPHRHMREIEHSYQCDIYIPYSKLVIECDGDHWHKYPKGNEIDHIRTKELQEAGFKVLRLWEREINGDINEIKNRIIKMC